MRNRISRRRTSHTLNRRVSQEDMLLRKLYKSLGALLGTVLLLVVIFSFFGPQVGSFFLLISKNRNNSGPADTIAPAAPVFSQVPEAVKDKNLTLNGITEAGATVKLYVNGPEKAQTTADNDGRFTFANVELHEGNNTVFAKAADAIQNESEKSKTFSIAFDDKKPEIDILTPNNGEEISNLDRRVLVQGKLNEEADVKVNGRQAVVKSDHTFELLLGVNEGDVEIKIEATDRAGNTSTESVFIKYTKSS